MERGVQRPPAEVEHQDELARLRAEDDGEVPPGWSMSMRAVRRFVLGSEEHDPPAKFVGPTSLIDRAMVALATQRALLLVGEPGVAKSYLAELLAAAISGDSTLTIQGGAAITEDQIRYGWNYALLVAEGPSERALVPAPILTGMRRGAIVRFEEITRCPLEVQDSLLGVLSERALNIPELGEASGTVYAREGFNVIATANTRDRGVNEMSAALRRRFTFETVFPIRDPDAELALVEERANRLLARSGVSAPLSRDVLDILVTTFRDLRETLAHEVAAGARSSMSTAECVEVAHAIGVRAHYLRGGVAEPEDVVEHLAGTVVKQDSEERARLVRYLDHDATKRTEPHWKRFAAARGRLDGVE
ncbi:MAG: AAA family ATPase [Sandaracinaceae bacterium]